MKHHVAQFKLPFNRRAVSPKMGFVSLRIFNLRNGRLEALLHEYRPLGAHLFDSSHLYLLAA